MEEENKLPLKRVELSLTKFNEVAIPHHLDLLRQHKANIIKYEELGQYARVRSEQTHARRVAAQLRSLLAELETLRRQVRADDVARFDKLTERSREHTLRAIMDYLDSSPMSISREGRGAEPAPSCAASSDSVGLVAHCPDAPDADGVQLQVDERELELRSREAALRGWGELQAEVRALHDAWQHVQAAALASRDRVGAAAAGVHVAADNVQLARASLASAERLKAGAYGVCGALAGALLGGPAGVLLGAKAGLAVGLAAGSLGYLGGAGLARIRRAPVAALPAPALGEEDGKKER